MGLILCATRGGEASYRTQDAAIALAKERGDDLVFLYVVDLHFLEKMGAPIVVDVENEITQMGDFFLLIAKERAAQQGIEARAICHTGTIHNEIKKAARQEGATLVVLGRPAGEESAFRTASLKAFAKQIEEETGAETTIV
jgi:nucleotide-binding universal stress UspA family protein